MDFETEFSKWIKDNKQHYSTLPLRICHCAECCTRLNLKVYLLHSKAIPSYEALCQIQCSGRCYKHGIASSNT